MKAYNFPLESLRTLRKQREQVAQQRYARALVLCDGAARVLQLAEEELKAGALAAYAGRRARKGRKVEGLQKVLRLV